MYSKEGKGSDQQENGDGDVEPVQIPRPKSQVDRNIGFLEGNSDQGCIYEK